MGDRERLSAALRELSDAVNETGWTPLFEWVSSLSDVEVWDSADTVGLLVDALRAEQMKRRQANVAIREALGDG